jgi:hypothetical protein
MLLQDTSNHKKPPVKSGIIENPPKKAYPGIRGDIRKRNNPLVQKKSINIFGILVH